MKWNEALGSLEKCEAELRRLLADAAAEGDYASVMRIADVAKALAALTSEGRGSLPLAPVPAEFPGLQWSPKAS